MKPTIEEWLLLVAMVSEGEPLPEKARKFVADLLDLVRRGEDPRPFAGTEKRDPRKNPRALVAMHYWYLREKYGPRLEKNARIDVASAWGLSPERVKKIGQNSKELRVGAKNAKMLGTLEETLVIFEREAQGSRSTKDRAPKKSG